MHTGVGSVGNCPSSDTNHPSSSDRDRATRFEADASWTSLSTKQAARLRNQSSIEPSQFYGRPPVFKHPPKVHLQARSSNEFSGAIPAKGDVCFTGKDFEVSMPSHQHSSETKSLNEVGDTTASTDPTSRLPDPLCTILARPVREKNSVREPFQPSQDHRVAMLPVPASVMLKRRKHWQPRDHQKKDAAENAEVMEFAKPPLKFSPSRPSKRQKHIHQSDDRHTDNSTSHSMEAPVIVSVGTRPSTPLSAPLYQNRQPSGGVLDDHFTPLQDSFNDNDSSKEQPNTAVDIVPSVPRQLSLTTRQSKRRRYQSMPAASSIAADIVNGTDEETQLTRSSVGQLGLHGLFSSARISLLQDVGHVLDEKFREFRSSLIAPVDQAPNPPIPPVAPITPATPATPAPNVPDTPRTKRRRQNEVWNRSHPAITTPVPENEKLTDSALIEVGKKVDPYDRHCAAPYAFSRRGALKIKEYKHLLTYRHEDGSPGWTAKEMVRLTH